MIKNFVKILELLDDRLEVCVSVYHKSKSNQFYKLKISHCTVSSHICTVTQIQSQTDTYIHYIFCHSKQKKTTKTFMLESMLMSYD